LAGLSRNLLALIQWLTLPTNLWGKHLYCCPGSDYPISTVYFTIYLWGGTMHRALDLRSTGRGFKF